MPTSQTRHYLFIAIAILCFGVGLILSLDWLDGGNESALLFGGLLALAAERLP